MKNAKEKIIKKIQKETNRYDFVNLQIYPPVITPFTIIRILIKNKYEIREFEGLYSFLSNSYECCVNYEGIDYSSAEAAFQAAKTLDIKQRREIAKLSPFDAKKAGDKLQLRPDWNKIKNNVMYDICKSKFASDKYLKRMLLATGTRELINGDTKSLLGETLMQIRDELRK